MTDKLTVAQIEALLTGTTPGEWLVNRRGRELSLVMDGLPVMCDMTYYPWVPENEADWRIMAAAPTLARTALDTLAEAERLRQAMEPVVGAASELLSVIERTGIGDSLLAELMPEFRGRVANRKTEFGKFDEARNNLVAWLSVARAALEDKQ